MSLYYDTAPFLDPSSNVSGSLKFRIFHTTGLKSKLTQVFALATEARKWSEILSEIIEKAQLLQQERKVYNSIIHEYQQVLGKEKLKLVI